MVTKTSPSPQKAEVSRAHYAELIASLKAKIRSAQVKGAIAVNRELIKLYWEIGKELLEKQEQEGWGSSVLERVAKDLQKGFPGVEGFSRRNMFRMKAFYQAYEKVPQAVAQLDDLPIFSIPWGHNALILEKVKNTPERLWYAQKALENGLSRSMLTIWIENNLYSREGKAITNFKSVLPPAQSELAQQTTKDPYIFDFISLHNEYLEKELEEGLVSSIQKCLLELGQGFAFVGQQYPLKAGEKDLYIDLLFYHLKLRCYIVVELKAGEFDSRDAGQMSAYLSAVDDQVRNEGDKPTIGLIFCKTKDNVFAEYVLRNLKNSLLKQGNSLQVRGDKCLVAGWIDSSANSALKGRDCASSSLFNRPIGVAGFEVKIVETLPTDLKSSLPTVEEIEAELSVRPSEKRKPQKQKKDSKNAHH